MLNKIKVGHKLLFLVIIFVFGFISFGIYCDNIITDLKINGKMYNQIVMGKDLVADILPPPEYIVESHLTTLELLNEKDSSKIEELVKYEQNLEKDYDTRHQVWVKELPEGNMKKIMVEDAYKPAKEYYSIFNNEFVPSIKSGDKQKAEYILNNKMENLYTEHRNNINKVVELANKQNSDIEAGAESKIKFDYLMLLIMAFGIVIFVIILCFLIIRNITAPLLFLRKHIKTIASGDLSAGIPDKWLSSKDEIGDITKATKEMQDSLKEIIQSIIMEAENVKNSVSVSNSNITELNTELEGASATVEQLSAQIEETASSTEEINAISKEIESAIETIADRVQEGALSAEEISKRALNLKNNSLALEDEADTTRSKIKASMDTALQKIEEVQKIKVLSDAILQIASETNLLALNAAIESARVGEAGKGFSVVAEQIRKLAENSETTVNEMKDIVNRIFEAVNNLVDISRHTLDYIETNVMDSYKESVQVGEKYDKDAIYVSSLVTDLSATSEELLASIKTVSQSIDEISKASNEGAAGTSDTADKVSKIRNKANYVKSETDNVKESIEHLKELVSKFKI